MARMGPTRQRNTEALASNLLRLARAKRGLTQAELSARAGVPQSTISRIEAGRRQPSLPTLAHLLAAADLDLRTRLEDYDDHDDVLDARYASLSAAQRESLDEQVAHADALLDAASGRTS